jgi:hypothetical protein
MGPFPGAQLYSSNLLVFERWGLNLPIMGVCYGKCRRSFRLSAGLQGKSSIFDVGLARAVSRSDMRATQNFYGTPTGIRVSPKETSL